MSTGGFHRWKDHEEDLAGRDGSQDKTRVASVGSALDVGYEESCSACGFDKVGLQLRPERVEAS